MAAGLTVAAYPAWMLLSNAITQMNAGPRDLHDMILKAPKTKARVAVIGMAISGIQAMKSCLAEGVEPVGFEADQDIGGFWRYKEDTEHPSVYRSTHIDTDRDLNSFGDYPWSPDSPLLIHNSELTRYLRENVSKFGLGHRIKFNTTVTLVTPEKEHDESKHIQDTCNKWVVHYKTTDLATGTSTEHVELFDGVLVCTGRHGGGGFIPKYPNQELFKGAVMHSSKYKYPEKHGMVGKRVAVVGIGNSGADIVTELGMLNGGGMRSGNGEIVNEANRSETLLVARSGGWVTRSSHMELGVAINAGDAIVADFVNRMPWFVRDNGKYDKAQEQLNKHGMTPGHRRSQQHGIASGIAGQVWLGDQLDEGWIKMHRGINTERGFTEDGLGIWLNDKDGNPNPEPTAVDAVIFATGYRQQAGFVDPKVVDLRFEREGNDVPLFKGCLPTSKYRGLGFINFIQSGTFPCAELQARYLLGVFKGTVAVPSLEEQQKEMEETRNALSAIFIDRQQLRIQHGVDLRYYSDLADAIGCLPTFWRVLTQRPTALWHAYFVFFGPIIQVRRPTPRVAEDIECNCHLTLALLLFSHCPQLTNRLVGPGRLENAESWIEEAYKSRHFGKYKSAGAGYDYNKLEGKLKNRDGAGPRNRRSALWVLDNFKAWWKFSSRMSELKGQVTNLLMSSWSKSPRTNRACGFVGLCGGWYSLH
jgi:dimethylaniline monooxygenase (N-oxide forming)